ncbi:MAG: tRNA guanosine(34) transglycosylase Tgt [Oscillospiraceae bacterium]|jgi:queuine tRNA-ribosyltransferase|nr:tRNA guanosine(34) transglycosylase Tgt [Oscillospiraceae bacterium]
MEFRIKKKEGRARRGEFDTAHGTVQTPVFMNVGTQAAVKGGVSTEDLEAINCRVELSNTYHLHLRPGEQIIKRFGGLHGFMKWDRPILTDSGGFQIYSLAKLRKIKEEGVYFSSHIDGRKIFMSPENSIQIQSALGSDIAMAFDECVEIPSPKKYVADSCERTYRWLVRCRDELERLNALPDTVNPGQQLFGINQGTVFKDLRIEHMEKIAQLDLPGYGIGGLSVGETTEEMYETLDAVLPHAPDNKPRYLMGVGTPENIVEGVWRGVDFFDCVMPARNGRHGKLYTRFGTINIKNEKYTDDESPIDDRCGCPVCRRYSRAYLRHLFKAEEVLALRFGVLHNLWYYNQLTEDIRSALERGEYEKWRSEFYRLREAGDDVR